MIYTILGKDEKAFADELKKYRLACVLSASAALLISIALLFLRSDETHNIFLSVNIILDIAVGWLDIFLITAVIRPRKKRLKLYLSKSTELCGSIASISSNTYRVGGFDCFKLTLAGESTRVFFLPNIDGIELDIGKQVRVRSVSNVITEVHI